MEEFFKWLSNNPIAANIALAAVCIVILSVVTIYLVAFFQGREISFWPPCIGPKVVRGKGEANLAVDRRDSLGTSKQGARGETKAMSTSDEFDVGLFREFPSSLKDDFEAAKELWLVGVSLNATVETYFSLLADKLRGRKFALRVLLVNPDPNSPAMRIAAMRGVSVDAEGQRLRTQSTLNMISKLKDATPKQIEVRVIDNPLAYEALVVNPFANKGKAYIRYYGFQTRLGDEPHFIVTSNSKHWFDFYSTEISNLWKAGKEYTGNHV